jgi:predicted dehydrogenase
MIDKARADALKSSGKATNNATANEYYRRQFDKASSFDAVLVETPNHWHAPLCKAFM